MRRKDKTKKPKVRRMWQIDPETRIQDSRKIYSRKRTKEELRKYVEELEEEEETEKEVL